MLVLNRFVVTEDPPDGFVQRAHAALAALAERPGYL
ncbi:MAG TPA: antibiotic biosynthesis monooxygenase, partial [Actinoplanes sp.]